MSFIKFVWYDRSRFRIWRITWKGDNKYIHKIMKQISREKSNLDFVQMMTWILKNFSNKGKKEYSWKFEDDKVGILPSSPSPSIPSISSSFSSSSSIVSSSLVVSNIVRLLLKSDELTDPLIKLCKSDGIDQLHRNPIGRKSQTTGLEDKKASRVEWKSLIPDGASIEFSSGMSLLII